MTFLFTDIEGSTRRWESDAAGMRAALAAHDEVLHHAIEARGGWLFKHTGDGVLAAFASPGSAVDAAVAAQRALELPVRMGIATGEAELRGDDYFGPVLNRAARVMSAGHGGQVLLADTTAGLLSGVDLLSLGQRRLRDLSTAIEVFQVRADGLRTEFPPLKAVDSSPGNLRPAASSLIGRDSEIARVIAALRAHRLVTLTGVGGVGKTRLALEVATRLAGEFFDGVWVFELAAVTDPASVPDAVAVALGITQQPGKSLTQSIAAALDNRVRLLVFDNCEHLIDAAADLIEAIRAESATVRFLATSREGLGIADEQLQTVPSLGVEDGADSPAVALFTERACSVAQHFSSLSKQESAAVQEICRRLDGIPLAIELAASRMSSMTASEVRDRLDQRFRLLVGTRRGLERHQTLRHAVSWSYDLLSDDERTLLERSSVFAGGFDLESACAVAGAGADEFAVLDMLDALVRKSLLVVDRSAGRTRYSMLETIRQFAEERLVDRGEASTIRAEHARHFAGQDAKILALWDSLRQREAFEWFDVEVANLRAAFRWTADHGDLDGATAIAILGSILGIETDNFEPVTWAEELIEPARTVGHSQLAALYVMAAQCYHAGRISNAVGYSNEGQSLVDSDEFGLVPFGHDGALGGPWVVIGESERAVEWCRSQLARDRDTHGFIRANLVLALIFADRAVEAIAATEGLVETAEATDNPWAISFALFVYGSAHSETDPPRALAAVRRSVAIATEVGIRWTQTYGAGMLARIEAEYGDPAAAMDYAEAAIRSLHDAGNPAVRVPLAVLVALFDRLGRYESAATIAGFAMSPLTTTGAPWFITAIAHIRGVLGEPEYESLARKGAAMTTAGVTSHAYDQMDQTRAELSGK
ncbi:adenylate/guanylate cyclase domain-containing protein [Mycobacterium hodleri]|uniref:Adenylate/guanylate cyclase domain-containing protein n=1 Tax=Mycolicibacterium hodleri TaxID=49897 RepID=A0A502DWM6_9MYCO|nr:adenylate/guanylate cyclase domain-containing protein [Mycolicibacterium hodleri]